MQNCSLHLVALTATYRRSLNSPLPSIINAWLNGQLAVSTSWSLGKEKYSRIDARIFPNPMGSSNFPCGHSKKDIAQAMVTRTGAFATLKENASVSKPDGFVELPVRAQQKSA